MGRLVEPWSFAGADRIDPATEAEAAYYSQVVLVMETGTQAPSGLPRLSRSPINGFLHAMVRICPCSNCIGVSI